LPESTITFANALSVPEVSNVVESTRNRVSVVIVLHNGVAYTKMCLWTLLSREWHSGDELILVDNASTDGTAAYLGNLKTQHPWIKVIVNTQNRGFAAANNQGIAVANGDILLLLNADTLMLTGWRQRVIRWLMDECVGMVGPVTNRTCNEAQIDAPYRTYGELERFAARYTAQHEADATPISMLAMFCVALRRNVYRQVGPLDERFEIGMFEDDDYARRIQQAGLKLLCAEDVFVHHFGQGSFGELCPSMDYDRILEKNRSRFEQKWGISWQPHNRRITPEYSRLRQQIQTITSDQLPAGSTIAVISKGDEELLKLNGHRGWHFPRAEDGAYANIYPADGKEAVSQVQSIRQQGAHYLLVPRPAFWWLEHYTELRDHLDAKCRLAFKDQDACLIFDLSDSHA
jgi:GT2 family glycosyltransferase